MPETEVIKHTAAIQINNNLTLLQRKISNVLLRNAWPDLSTTNRYSIRLTDLAKIVGFASNDEELLKNSLRVLNVTQLEWNILGKDKSKEWGVSTVVSSVKFRNGVCFYEYSYELIDKLKNPNIYAKLDLLVQRDIRSKHTQALWEYLISELTLSGQSSCMTPWVSIESLQKLLGVEGEYQEFKIFNRDVVKKSLKELTKTNISARQEREDFRREKRRVVAMRFRVERKEDFQPRLDLTVPLLSAKKTSETNAEDSQQVLDRMRDIFGVTKSTADKLVAKYPVDRINDAMMFVENEMRHNRVKSSVAGYLVKAVEAELRLPERLLSEAVSPSPAAEQKLAQEKLLTIRSDVEGKVRQWLRTSLRSRKAKMSDAELDDWKNKFADHLTAGAKGAELAEQFAISSWKMTGINTMFDGFLRESLFGKEIDILRQEAAKRGHDYDELLKL